ncbi:MAG: hypothetical protein AW10_03198 [Candidatus Accumulibacter appositus]|uniref:Uncharacterized protein n=1 Tax=Candidatus Accumulibacter appositus TaxID=1454003 RepID=A0A011N6J1_9PROT|nr:hypothetical protein [Accumulibacter sp.]EXI78228.1 MAG: hypothetical protein AW10_03198 [Candidatus Accumulibacter appositus]HRF06597.1 hypothetical protein [Accumulibacter sp.]
MKNLISSKLSCAVMVGLLMPLSVVTASDYESPYAAFNDATYPELVPASEGARGPIRSDMTDASARSNAGFNDASYPELAPAPEGAKGPIRSDMTDASERPYAAFNDATYPELVLAPEGASGPIRSDMTDDR